jgi:hypothetical protein
MEMERSPCFEASVVQGTLGRCAWGVTLFAATAIIYAPQFSFT